MRTPRISCFQGVPACPLRHSHLRTQEVAQGEALSKGSQRLSGIAAQREGTRTQGGSRGLAQGSRKASAGMRATLIACNILLRLQTPHVCKSCKAPSFVFFL